MYNSVLLFCDECRWGGMHGVAELRGDKELR